MTRQFRMTGVALVLAAGGLLPAQEVTGTLTGSVMDTNGKPIAGTLVRISSKAGIQDRSITTDANGNFRIPLLLTGDYTVTVSREGYIGAKATLRVSGGQVVRQEFNLKATTTTSVTVEVVATAAQVDKTQTKTASTITQEEMDAIPVSNSFVSRALAGLALSPGVGGPNQLYQSVRGGGQGQAQYLVNGLSVRDNITMQGRPQDVILDDLIDESQIILSPLNAKYGDSSAGLINVIEKTGGNEFTGSIRIRLDRPTWSALLPAGYNRAGRNNSTFQQTPTDSLSRQYEIAVTGPIIKDKLTFTFGTRLTPSSLTTVTAGTTAMRGGATRTVFQGVNVPADIFATNQAFSGTTRFTFNQGRLYWKITPDHSIDYSHAENFNQFFDYNSNTATPLPPDLIDTAQTSDTKFRQITYRGVFGTSHIVEARYGKRDSKIKFTSGPGDPIQLGYGPSTMTHVGQSTTFPFINGATADTLPEGRDTESGTINYSSYIEMAGSHSIDIGYNYIKTIWGTVQNSGGPNGRVFFVPGKLASGDPNTGFIVFPYNTRPAGVTQSFAPSLSIYTGVENATLEKPTHAVYANDQWSINNHWSAMVGVRYEKYSYSDGKGERYNSNSISPRMEVKWDLKGDQRRVLSFSYGQFRGNVGERITREYSSFRRTVRIDRLWDKTGPGGAFTDYTVTRADVLNPANYGYVLNFTVPDAVYAFDSGFKPEVNHEAVLGYKRSYAAGGFISVNLVNRRWKDLPQAFGSLSPVSITDPTGSSTLVKTNYIRTFKNDPEAKREYNAIETEFKAPLIPGKLTLQGSYSYSRTTANTTYGDSTGFALTQALAQTGLFRTRLSELGVGADVYEPYGLMPTSQGNVLRLLLVYTANYGSARSTFSLLGRYADGAPETATNSALIPGSSTTTSVSGLNPSFPTAGILPISYTHYYNGRAPFSSPYTHSIDFGWVIQQPVGKKVVFFSELNVVNLLNNIRPATLDRTSQGGVQSPGPLGYRVSNVNNYGYPTSSASFIGARDFNLTLGLKF